MQHDVIQLFLTIRRLSTVPMVLYHLSQFQLHPGSRMSIIHLHYITSHQQPQITLTSSTCTTPVWLQWLWSFCNRICTSLVKGENPVSVQYIQHSMRQLLLFCIEKKKKDVFPRQQRPRENTIYIIEQEIFGVACSYWLSVSSKMISCCNCNECYHRECVGLNKKPKVLRCKNCK